MQIISDDNTISNIVDSEIHLGKVRDIKIEYQLEIDVLIDKFKPVLHDSEALDKWSKEQDDIGSIVKEHAEEIRTRTLKFVGNSIPVSKHANLSNILPAPRERPPLPDRKENDSSWLRNNLAASREKSVVPASIQTAHAHWLKKILPRPALP